MNKHSRKINLAKNRYPGFTLIELLIVVAILGILSVVAVGSFKTAQLRGRDTQRKSDLKQISNALEIFYQDYGHYPDSSGSEISSCPFSSQSGTGSACSWGESEMTDGKTTYLKLVPADPSGIGSYIYKVSSSKTKYQLFSYLENSQDKNINTGITVSCGSANCNFSITSPNTSPTESL